MKYNFNPTTVKLIGSLNENCIDTNYQIGGHLKDEVYFWLADNCREPGIDRYYISTGYNGHPTYDYTLSIRFDYEELANWFVLRWS